MILSYEIPEDYRFHERFKYFIGLSGLKQKDIAKKLNVTDGAVNKWKDGSRFPKDEQRLLRISEILGIKIVDLFPNSKQTRNEIVKEELKNNIDNYIDYIPNNPLPSTLKKIPFDHGNPTSNRIILENSMENATHIYIDKLMLSKEYQQSKELKAVAIIGDSMEPCLSHGDVVIYTPTNHYMGKGKYVLQSSTGLEVASVSKLRKENTLVVSSDNPTYPTETFNQNELDLLEFIGFVIGSIRRS